MHYRTLLCRDENWYLLNARSNTDLLLSNSFEAASQSAYLHHIPIWCLFRLIWSSKSFRFAFWYWSSSSLSVMNCFGCFCTSSKPLSLASRKSCSAVICIGAGALFFACIGPGIFTVDCFSQSVARLLKRFSQLAGHFLLWNARYEWGASFMTE